MAITDLIEKLGRAIFEAPFGALETNGEEPELAEIRLAALDAVKANSHRAGGKDVFPYNVVRIHLRGIPEEKSGMFQSGFFLRFFDQELRTGLERMNCRFPDDLRVAVETSPALPGPKDPWVWVETESQVPEAPSEPVRRKAARLVVVKGAANKAEFPLTKARTNIGRTVDIYRSDGPSRRNDIAFTEENEVSRSVSREHAHILFEPATGEYRLFNDRSAKPGGLWIIRDGLSREVHRDARGVRLEPGDEIHLGRAVLQFRR